MTGLSFLVTSANTQKVLYFKERTFQHQYTPNDLLVEIKKEISTHQQLADCTEIVLVYANTTYTLVPQSLFDETKLSEYLKFNSKILIGDYITHDPIERHLLHVIYVPFVNINNYFFETFGSFQYFHAASILLETISRFDIKVTDSKAYIHVQEDHFDLVIIKHGKLLLCNSYPFKTPEDLVYYVLFAFEQANLNPDSIETEVLGTIESTDKNFEILYTYIRNIATGKSPHEVAIEGSAPHKHFLLKNIP